MQTRLRLLHDWERQARAPPPGSVSLPRAAAARPLAACPSTERRLRRWLANPAVTG